MGSVLDFWICLLIFVIAGVLRFYSSVALSVWESLALKVGFGALFWAVLCFVSAFGDLLICFVGWVFGLDF